MQARKLLLQESMQSSQDQSKNWYKIYKDINKLWAIQNHVRHETYSYKEDMTISTLQKIDGRIDIRFTHENTLDFNN